MNVNSPGPPDYAPAPAASGEAAQARRQLATAVQTINQSDLLGPGRELTLGVDPATRRSMVRIVNSETGEVLDQIPSELVLELSGAAAKAPG